MKAKASAPNNRPETGLIHALRPQTHLIWNPQEAVALLKSSDNDALRSKSTASQKGLFSGILVESYLIRLQIALDNF
ncbi:hypothetical protein CEXT_664341 [Caerostris extrusa]|uniref:Uncharacterized protein n=1 Tax=Caerostris extrusa TaxID=172846 RepID=A0AAV4X532_CAEEX|nr:hypothetical protein CEXT_664341 [Caerostris extrusa]